MILGIQMGHDASCALVDTEGRILYAASEERFTRRKNQERYPAMAVAEGLRVVGAQPPDVRALRVAWSKFPARFFRRESRPKELEKKADRARRALLRTVGVDRPEPYIYLDALDAAYRRRGRNVLAGFRDEAFRKWTGFVNADLSIEDHHLCHAASAAVLAGFPDPLIMTADGCGGHLSHTTSVLEDGRIKRIAVTEDAASPGNFYGDIARLHGWDPKRHCGKITGLAAYGCADGLASRLCLALDLSPDASHFVSAFSDSLDPDGERLTFLREATRGSTWQDIAAAAQQVLENAVVGHVRALLRRTGKCDVVLAGGVFANVKLNQRIMEIGEVDRVFVTPPMGDEGLAVGAACLTSMLSSSPLPPLRGRMNMYLGPSYSSETCARALKEAGYTPECIPDEILFPKIADWLAKGLVVGWFQGRMEFGPRALGNRSILAAPFDPSINDRLNKRLSRSEFMPFAPSVLEERAGEMFEHYSKAACAAEFMTVTFTVKPAWRDRIPAVVHVDKTARPQVVRRAANPRFYDLIRAFEKKTGVPAVLNTSFNVHEEPIVRRPEEAVGALKENRVDVLVMENWVGR